MYLYEISIIGVTEFQKIIPVETSQSSRRLMFPFLYKNKIKSAFSRILFWKIVPNYNFFSALVSTWYTYMPKNRIFDLLCHFRFQMNSSGALYSVLLIKVKTISLNGKNRQDLVCNFLSSIKQHTTRYLTGKFIYSISNSIILYKY